MKLEGGRKRLDSVAAILDAEIPVMGHIGLTPQSIHALGGFKVQGKQMDAAQAIVDDAVALAEAGCFAIVLECVPDGVARMVTDSVDVPTIGIGAGRHCDGQVLVFHDLLGFAGPDRSAPKFVRRYAELEDDGDARGEPLRRRRARRPLPVERRDVPHDRPDGRRASTSTATGRARPAERAPIAPEVRCHTPCVGSVPIGRDEEALVTFPGSAPGTVHRSGAATQPNPAPQGARASGPQEVHGL